VPTDDTRKQVSRLNSFGFTHDQIATVLGIDAKTLRKHYAVELARSKMAAHEKIVGALFAKAMRGDTAALIWWTKAQLGWSEKTKTELSGPNNGPIQQDVKVDDKRTPADARALMRQFFGNVGPQEDDNAATPEAHTGGEGGTAEVAASP
jgi:hypothetical protein